MKKTYTMLGFSILIFLGITSIVSAETSYSNFDKLGNGLVVHDRSTEGVSITDEESYTSYNFSEGYAITDEYSITSPGSTGKLIHHDMKAGPIIANSVTGISATASADSASGVIGQNIISSGKHTVQINNFSDRMQTYRIEYILQGKVGRHFHAYSAHVQPNR